MARWLRSALLSGLLALGVGAAYSAAMAADAPAATPVPAGLVSYKDLLDRPHGTPTARLTYGSAPQQYGDLWLPKGPGKHPVVVLIHGGCWLASLPSTELMDQMAQDLQTRGYAVWNLAYRRVGEAGGGYPGTFSDIAAGIDFLNELDQSRHLDLGRVVAVGHSAGGHLAAWAIARDRLPSSSPLHAARPLHLRGAVSLAGILDLEFARKDGLEPCGGPPTIDSLVGAAERKAKDLYGDTSPSHLLPFSTPVTLLTGALDPIVPPRYADDFAPKARAAGSVVAHQTLPGAGHFELIDPKSKAWTEVLAAIRQTLTARAAGHHNHLR